MSEQSQIPSAVDLNYQIHLKEYIRVLFARKWIVFSTSIVIFILSLLYVVVKTPIYISRAKLLIETGNVNLTEFKSVDPIVSGSELARQSYLETMATLITARPIIEKTFNHFAIQSDSNFAQSPDPISQFSKLFKVNKELRSQLITISFQWPDPEVAANVLDYLTREFIAETRKRKLGVTMDGYLVLKQKGEELRPKLEAKAEELQNFMVSYGIASFEKTQNIIIDRLKEVNIHLAQTERNRIRAETICENIANSLKGRYPLIADWKSVSINTVVESSIAKQEPIFEYISLEGLPEVEDSQTIRDYKLEYLKAQQSLDDLSARFGPNHPQVIAIKARVKAIIEKLNNEFVSIFSSAKSNYLRSLEAEEELRKELAEQKERVVEFNKLSLKYQRIQNAYDTLEKTYQAINKRLEEIEITTATGSKYDNIFIVEPAEIPVRVAKPRKIRVVALGIIVGIILGCGLCFFVDYFDTTMKTKDDVGRIMNLPVLGYIPNLGAGDRIKTKKKYAIELTGLMKPRSSLAEAFRSVRTAINFSSPQGRVKRLLVTSTSPQEGKTLSSANIAMAMAQSGKKVLLIDADMRKPRLHKIFNINPEKGLSNLLIEENISKPMECYFKVKQVKNLFVIPCGPIPPNPAELLESERLTYLIDQWEQIFDLIIFDTPPATNVTDPVILAKYIDGVILVLRAFHTQKEQAIRTKELMAQTDCKIFGVIINNIDVPQGGYYSYDAYYQQYCQYYGTDDPDAECESQIREYATAT